MAQEKIVALITQGLNRPVGSNMINSLVCAYKEHKDNAKFAAYCSSFGLKDPKLTNEIYQEIAANEKQLTSQVHVQKDKKRPKSSLKLDWDTDQDITDALTLEKQGSGSIDTTPNHDSSTGKAKKTRPMFKKIKKEKVEQIKKERMSNSDDIVQEMPQIKSNSTHPEPKELTKTSTSLASLAALERDQNTQTQENNWSDIGQGSDLDSQVNDREWYMNEENGITVLDHESTYEAPSDSINSRTYKNSNSNLTGGSYNDQGQYIDHDHDDQQSDLSRIPLTSHFLVPPFLEESKEHLSVVMNHIGSTINPIKDPTSELAIAARSGSNVVKDIKASTEKAKQARQRANIAGTALGNVLGVKQIDEDKPTESTNHKSNNQPIDKNEIDKQRKSLPAYSVKDDLLKTIRDNQVTIVIGETGSGKTTQLTQFLYEDGFCSKQEGINRIIGCTQPRRVAAVSVAKRVADEMGVKVGQECGFAIRFEDMTSSKTAIKYMTDGILLKEILTDPRLEKYSCIIMDEAHERSLNTDVLLGLFKQVLAKRRDLKLIVTSATLNADRFSKFFGGAPQFTIPGRTFPVDVMYSRTSVIDYVESAVKQVLTIHLKNRNQKNDGDILVFMTGQEDVEATCQLISERLSELEETKPLDIYPIYSTLPADLQQKIFAKSDPNRRKCVVATNIAETSLTVDGVRYVVDCGLSKVKVFNPKLGMDALQVVPISFANAQQRSGRAGRTAPGIAYRMYTERATRPEAMYIQPVPEIQRTNLSNVVLSLRSLGVKNILEFPFLDPPPKDLLACSLYDLWSIGALDSIGNLTSLGKEMAQFPMDPSMAKLILKSFEYNCSEEILTIVSMLSVPSVWFRPKERASEADISRERFSIAESDHLTLNNVYLQWESIPYGGRAQWCAKNFLHHKSLLRAKEIRQQLKQIVMKKSGRKLQRATNDEIVRKCICATYFHQAAKLVRSHRNNCAEYIHLRHNFMKMYVHPTSALNGDISPSYVVYNELILTSREYMSCVTAVNPLWLVEFGYVFYGLNPKLQHKLTNENMSFITKEELKAQLDLAKIKWKEQSESGNIKKRKPLINQGRIQSRRGGL